MSWTRSIDLRSTIYDLRTRRLGVGVDPSTYVDKHTNIDNNVQTAVGAGTCPDVARWSWALRRGSEAESEISEGVAGTAKTKKKRVL
jgi:hypothetical protein